MRAPGGSRSGNAPAAPEPDGGGSFKDIFSQFFRGGSRRSRAEPSREKGADLEYGLNITFWEAIRGTQTKIEITRYEQCAICHGAGGNEAGSCAARSATAPVMCRRWRAI